MKKLPSKTLFVVMPFFLTMFMTAIVSAISVIHTIGIGGLKTAWLGSWLWSWAVAFPTLVCVLPLVRKIVSFIVESTEK